MNYGEELVNGFHVDGFAMLPMEDGSVCKTAFEYNGCRWHRCRYCTTACVQTDEEYLKDQARLGAINEEAVVITMYECRWLEQRKHLDLNMNRKPRLSQFLSRPQVSQNEILQAVRNGTFFGLCKVKITTPDAIIKKYESLNFGWIFDKKVITEDMVNPKMKDIAEQAGRKFPYTVMTLAYHSDNRILATPLLKFYLSIGMKVEKLYYAIQYIEDAPFTEFVSQLVDVRVNSIGVNEAAGDR